MDEKLSKALEFGNYSTTLNNQRRMLKEKFATESMYFFAGGQFTITKELINYVYTLKSTEQDSFVLIDDTEFEELEEAVDNNESELAKKDVKEELAAEVASPETSTNIEEHKKHEVLEPAEDGTSTEEWSPEY